MGVYFCGCVLLKANGAFLVPGLVAHRPKMIAISSSLPRKNN